MTTINGYRPQDFRIGKVLDNVEAQAKTLPHLGVVTETEINRLEKVASKLRYEMQFKRNEPGHPGHALLSRVEGAIEAFLVPCNGEAHSNAFIDNCMCCAPRWGKVIGPRVIRLEDEPLKNGLTRGQDRFLRAALEAVDGEGKVDSYDVMGGRSINQREKMLAQFPKAVKQRPEQYGRYYDVDVTAVESLLAGEKLYR